MQRHEFRWRGKTLYHVLKPVASLKADTLYPRLYRYTMLDGWRNRIVDHLGRGHRAIVWGSGSKGVAFLTSLGLGDAIEYVVDINPHRQGTFMATTGHRIVGPDALREAPPDLVIVMNPVYRDEIAAEVERQGLQAEVITT